MDSKLLAIKIREARVAARLTQAQLAEHSGMSCRMVQSCEQGTRIPRMSSITRIAKVLGVSTTYLLDDKCSDPQADIEADKSYEYIRQQLNGDDARAVETVMRESTALFAGGTLSDDQKDEYYRALTDAYIACKKQAKEKYKSEDD